MTTFTWSFPHFDVAKSEDGLTDVVKTIHWRYDAVDGDYSASSYGTVGVNGPNPTNFILFADLTKVWAIAAVSELIDVAAISANLETQIANAKNPPIVSMNPPFVD
jgi:hypothetical protein